MKRKVDKQAGSGRDSERRRRRARMDRNFRMCIAIVVILLGCLGGVGYWAHQQFSLERSFQQQYGPDWLDELARYHGPAAHVHRQIEVTAVALLSLIGIFAWLGWRAYQLRERERFTYHSV